MHGVDLILGNDSPWEKIFPTSEVVETPVPDSDKPVSAAVNLRSPPVLWHVRGLRNLKM